MLEVLLARSRAVVAFLFEPHVSITRDESRRQARLISALLFVATMGIGAGAIYTPEHLELVRLILGIVFFPSVFLYFLSRTRYYLIAAAVAIPLLMLTPYLSVSAMPVYNQALVAEKVMWLLEPMFLAVITLPFRVSILFLLFNIVLLSMMPGWIPEFEPAYLGNGLSFIIISTVLLFVIAAIRDRDVNELHLRTLELQQQKQWLEDEIKERRQVELEVGNLQTLINSVNEAVLLISTSGVIERVNETSMKMFGYRQSEFIGKNTSLLLEPSSLDTTEPLLARFLTDEKDNVRHWHSFMAQHANGQVFPVEAFASLIDLQGVKGFVVTVRDVSEHKRVEKLKDEFVSSVSHELRTPLTSIQGSLGIINGMYRPELSDKVRQLLDIAYENSSSLCGLVDDILDISKLEAGQMAMHYETVNIPELMQELLRNCAPMAVRYTVQYRLAEGLPDLSINTDRMRISQVIRNLLSNAAKFSHSGGEVEIDYTTDKEYITFAVTDHGIGIPEESLEKVFDKFYQVQATSKQARSGTGLGLSISKRIVQQLGGRIWVESRPGNTCFRIKLPLTHPSAS